MIVAAAEAPPLVAEFGIVLAATAVFGYLAERLKLVSIVGYLVAGALIGPLALGWIDHMPRIIGVQAEGSAFMYEAWVDGEDVLTKAPVSGVTVGVMALIVVIAVMAGFETDLRSRFLNTEAHITVRSHLPSFTDYRIMTSMDAPRQIIADYVEVPQDDGPWGARGVGEHPMIATAPAIAGVP